VRELALARSLAGASNAAWAAAGVVAVGAGGMALFTDWMGYRAASGAE
jgi:hypothetical protein